jgi:hypothetical protein
MRTTIEFFSNNLAKLKSNAQYASKSSFNDFQFDSHLTQEKSQAHSTLSNEHLPKDCKVKNQGI